MHSGPNPTLAAGFGHLCWMHVLVDKLGMAIVHVVYYSAKATDPDVDARFETRLHLMCDIVCFFPRSLFVIAAVIYKQVKAEKSRK